MRMITFRQNKPTRAHSASLWARITKSSTSYTKLDAARKMLNGCCAVRLGAAAGCLALRVLNAGCAVLLGDAAGGTALLEDEIGCTEAPMPLYIGVCSSRSFSSAISSFPLPYCPTSFFSHFCRFQYCPCCAFVDTSFPFASHQFASEICLLKRRRSSARLCERSTAALYSSVFLCFCKSSMHFVRLAGCSALSDGTALH